MNPVMVDLGIIKIYYYSVMILIGMLTGAFLIYKTLLKKGFSEEFITDLIFYTIIFGILGARIYYVLFNLPYYSKNILEIFEIWNGGLAIHGGIIGGVLWIVYYCKKKNVNILKITDVLCISLILAQAIGRWGNFFNKEAHGAITSLEHLQSLHIPKFIINGMYINGNYYLPTFYFEFLLDIGLFIILILVRKYVKNPKNGLLTGLYFSIYSIGRFFIEGLRTDSLMLGNLRIARVDWNAIDAKVESRIIVVTRPGQKVHVTAISYIITLINSLIFNRLHKN